MVSFSLLVRRGQAPGGMSLLTNMSSMMSSRLATIDSHDSSPGSILLAVRSSNRSLVGSGVAGNTLSLEYRIDLLEGGLSSDDIRVCLVEGEIARSTGSKHGERKYNQVWWYSQFTRPPQHISLQLTGSSDRCRHRRRASFTWIMPLRVPRPWAPETPSIRSAVPPPAGDRICRTGYLRTPPIRLWW